MAGTDSSGVGWRRVMTGARRLVWWYLIVVFVSTSVCAWGVLAGEGVVFALLNRLTVLLFMFFITQLVWGVVEDHFSPAGSWESFYVRAWRCVVQAGVFVIAVDLCAMPVGVVVVALGEDLHDFLTSVTVMAVAGLLVVLVRKYVWALDRRRSQGGAS